MKICTSCKHHVSLKHLRDGCGRSKSLLSRVTGEKAYLSCEIERNATRVGALFQGYCGKSGRYWVER